MVTLHIAKYSQMAIFSLLLISLPSFCADDAALQPVAEVKNIIFSCNIPGLNIPLQLERTENGISKVALVLTAIDHGRLLHTQLKSQQSLQGMLIDHALLAAFRITIGLTSTVCHEFGHAICAHYDPYTTLQSITLGWSPANMLLGRFDKAHITKEQNVSDVLKDDDQPFEIRCKNWVALLNQYKDKHRNAMIGCAAGPLMGALSTYMIYKGVECSYPSLPYKSIVFHAIEDDLENMIPINHMFNHVCDSLAARARNDEVKREIEELRPKFMTDGDHFYEAWKKRKERQEQIDELSSWRKTLAENAP